MPDSAPADVIIAEQKTITNRRLRAMLRALGACQDGRDWVGDRDLATAWAECERADYLLWCVAQVGVGRTLVVRAAALCAQTALQFVPAGEDRPRLCVEAVLAWADAPSVANLKRVRQARRDAVAAAYAAAYAATYAAARRDALKRCADIVRETIPVEAVLAAATSDKEGQP